LAAGVQKDFCPGGLLPVHQGGEAVAPVNLLSAAAKMPFRRRTGTRAGIALSPRRSRDACPMRQCSLARPSYPGNAWGAVACGSSNPASRT
jgi:hypothetical protein